MMQREQALDTWLQGIYAGQPYKLLPMQGDASFRRYLRLHKDKETRVVMDAPPEKEDSHPYVAIAQTFSSLNLHVPEIYAADLQQGFLLLSDLGERLYLRELNQQTADSLYKKALQSLIIIQSCQKVDDWVLPHFDQAFIGRELNFFKHWFLEKYLQLELDGEQQVMLTKQFALLIANAQQQPQVCVHRDYHSRNLMLLDNGGVGILDFQDAVWGPVMYDVVSLLRDCYIAWPHEQVEEWLSYYYYLAIQNDIITDVTLVQLQRWFDVMGIQRHLKASFIFARKYLRDGHNGFLADIPRTLNYVLQVGAKYPELDSFNEFLSAHVMPCLCDKSGMVRT